MKIAIRKNIQQFAVRNAYWSLVRESEPIHALMQDVLNDAGIQDKASLVVCGRLFLKLPDRLFGLGLMEEFGSPAFRTGLRDFVEANRAWIDEACSAGDAGRASSILEAGFVSSEEDLDEDGYPTEAACLKLEQWPWEDIRGWFAYARSLWHHAEYGWHETTEAHASKPGEIVDRIEVSTVGWSGNETLIRAMKKNPFLWQTSWVQARRGGHYVFELEID